MAGWVFAALALAIAPVAGGAPGLGTRAGVTFGPTPFLQIDAQPHLFSSMTIATSSWATSVPAARVAVYVPTRYTLRSPAVETRIGLGIVLDVSTTTSDSSALFGELVVADPASIDATVFVDAAAAGDPAGAAYRLQFCPPSAGGSRFLAASIVVEDAALAEPTAPASYVWRAFVTPVAPGAAGPDPTQTYELRAVAPLPRLLTMAAVYNPKARRATLSGRLTVLGRGMAGVRISFTAHSTHVRAAFFGPARTDASGRYSTTWPISEKTDFTASAEGEPPAPCPIDASSPPGGCASQTTSVPGDVRATVRPPRRGDPKLQPTAADRALAARVNAKLSDFPAGWEAEPTPSDGAVVCPDVQPDESKLTLTGTSASPYFYSESSDPESAQAVLSSVKVWKTPADAKTAFARETPASEVKCVLELEDTTVISAGTLPSPLLGRGSRAYRVLVQVPDENGGTLAVYLDLVEILGKRSLVTMTFVSAGAPPAIEGPLTQKIGRRAAAA